LSFPFSPDPGVGIVVGVPERAVPVGVRVVVLVDRIVGVRVGVLVSATVAVLVRVPEGVPTGVGVGVPVGVWIAPPLPGVLVGVPEPPGRIAGEVPMPAL